MKIQITRATTQGEMMAVEIVLKDNQDFESVWKTRVAPAIAKMDARVYEMNMRYMTATKVAEQFPPEYRGMLRQAVDALYGQDPERLSAVSAPRVGNA